MSEISTQTWNIDSTHSSTDFSVKHMGVFTVRGALGSITGTAKTQGDTLVSIDLAIDANGITTNNEQRDGHLKSGDFFDVENFPTINFKSSAANKKSETEYTVVGDLTMHGTTAPFSVDVELVPPLKDPWGNTRSGATGSGKLKRSEYGLTYNSVMETGGVLISDEIKFTFDIQAVTA